MKEVVRRGDNLEDLEAPTLWINPNVDDFSNLIVQKNVRM